MATNSPAVKSRPPTALKAKPPTPAPPVSAIKCFGTLRDINTDNTDNTNTNTNVLLVSPARGRSALGIGRSKMAEMIATGTIKSVLIGRRRLIPIGELQRIAKHGCA
jgi:hypothetical protein